MKIYNRIFLIFMFFCVIFANLLAQETDDDFFDDDFFIESETESSPDMEVSIKDVRYVVSDAIDPLWIASLLGIKEGETYRLGDLQKEIERVTQKLTEMNHFFSINIYEFGSISDDKQRIVVVELTDGFWYSFMFAPYDITIARNHLNGSNKSIQGTLGTNTQEIMYTDPSIGYTPFFGKLRAGNRILNEDVFLMDLLEAELEGGYNITDYFAIYLRQLFSLYSFPDSYFLYPDFVALENSRKIALNLDTSHTAYRPHVGITLTPQYKDLIKYNFEIFGGMYFFLDDSNLNFYFAGAYSMLELNPLKNLRFVDRHRIVGGLSSVPEFVKYPLADDFRGDLSVSKGDYYVSTQLDLELHDLIFFDLRTFDLDIRPFLYFDTGKSFEHENQFSLENSDWAAGGGAHIYFSYPVGIFVSLASTFSHANDFAPGFIFCVTNSIY